MKNDIRGLRLENNAWVYSYRIAGRARCMTIGHAPGLVPADARKAAQHFAGLVAIGRDPGAERKAARTALKIKAEPVRDLIEPVVKRYLRHAKARTRASTFAETSRVMAKEVLPKWRGRRLSEISRADVRQLIAAIAARPAPVSANRCLASLKTFLAFAVEQDAISVSPAASVRAPAVEKALERTLSDDELGAVLRASYGLGAYGAGAPTFGFDRRAAIGGFRDGMGRARPGRESVDVAGGAREKRKAALGSAIGAGGGDSGK
jgi:hypothetical protein